MLLAPVRSIGRVQPPCHSLSSQLFSQHNFSHCSADYKHCCERLSVPCSVLFHCLFHMCDFDPSALCALKGGSLWQVTSPLASSGWGK